MVIAVGFDLAAHGRIDSWAMTVGLVLTVGGLLASGRVRTAGATLVALVAVPFAVLVAWHESAWLVPVDAVMAVGLLALGASYAAGGRVLGISWSGLVVRLGRSILAVAMAPAFALGSLAALVPWRGEDGRRRMLAVARGVGLALPVVLVLGLLLASADAVFASIFRVPVDLGSTGGHLILFTVGLVVGAALLVDAEGAPVPEVAVGHRPLGATEAVVVLVAVVVLFAGFAATQLMVVAGGAERVLATAGLTYAENARQGFFQLLGVAGITLALLLGIRAALGPVMGPTRWLVVGLGEAAVLLTLVIVAGALNRLSLYEQAYGLTMLRLACVVVAWWLAAVFVLVGAALAGVGARRRWIFGAIVVAGVVALFVFNVMDPEAVVVRHNVAHEQATGSFDTSYLHELSDDAIPELVAALPALPPATRDAVRDRVCRPAAGAIAARSSGRRPEAPDSPRTGLDANRSATRAAAVRAEVCAR